MTLVFQVIGLRFFNPFELFGALTPLVLATAISAIAGFFIAGIFIFIYHRKLSQVGEVPKGWDYFFVGLMLNSLYQVLKIPFTLNFVYGDIFIILFLVFQIFVVFIMVYGLYLLKKEVEIK